MPDIKETLIDLLTGYSLDTYEDVQYVADELIAKGVLLVVRCSECRRRYDHNECPMCFLIDGVYHEYTSGIGFCDRGERKDGEG